ncbi:metal ABC transporter solute-binding protein, Zn/Mn family [Orrella sp. 11846]|uniref:metal ABC transporter solute-binding protein, Zn/Mn family n=1 Tax=Orrella sp. 11846 TaxID=3409913 RepID=UPI003B5A1BCB
MRAIWVRFLVIALGFCSSVALATIISSPPNTDAPKVVTSFSILADMVEQIAGDMVRVHPLVGPNADAHVFSPSPSDVREVAQADLVVVNGLGFEGWMQRLVQASDFKGPVVVATDGIAPLDMEDDHDHHKGHHDHHDHGQHDPHAWQDLNNARVYVANIRDGLIAILPAQRAQIEAGAQRYLDQIDELDERLQAQFAAVPPGRRLLVSHDAFAYLAKAYDLDIAPLQGRSTDRDVSAADMAQLIREIRDGEIHAYFIENMADPRMMQQVARETGLADGGKLYSDALSAPGSEADTYLKLYELNAQKLLNALKDR